MSDGEVYNSITGRVWIYAECRKCGRKAKTRVPKDGDGTFRMPYKHKVNGQVCLGSYDGAKGWGMDD